MRKIFFYTVICALAFLLIQCSGSTTTENIVTNTKVSSDTSFDNNTIESSKLTSMQSEITCPKCGHKKMEILPTDVCLLRYTCEKCNATLYPKEGDCCVFCTYGTHKCPSKQGS